MSIHHLKVNNRIWNVLRIRIFERDKYRCVLCGKAGALECDHVIPLQHGGAITKKVTCKHFAGTVT